jgi:hypothetical protein
LRDFAKMQPRLKIKSSKLPGPTPIERLIKARNIVGKTAIRNFTKQVIEDDKEWDAAMNKAMKKVARERAKRRAAEREAAQANLERRKRLEPEMKRYLAETQQLMEKMESDRSTMNGLTDKQKAVIAMFDTAIKAQNEYRLAQKRAIATFHQAFDLAKKAGWTPSELFVEMSRMATTGAQLQQARSEFARFCRGETDVKPKTDEWNGWL